MRRAWKVEDGKGWVIAGTSPLPSGNLHTFYWYGPEHGWSNTWGAAKEAAVFDTRAEAEEAHRKIYGRGWRNDRLRSTTKVAVRLSDVLEVSK